MTPAQAPVYDPAKDARKGTNVRNDRVRPHVPVNRTAANSENNGKPFLLDLFCGAGGAAMGYKIAGFESSRIVGVDIQRFRHYPFTFVQGNALSRDLLTSLLEKYPITHIHASPPCQAYSSATAPFRVNGSAIPYGDFVHLTRDLLEETKLPYVIENVEGAPLIKERTITLCGTMPVFQGKAPHAPVPMTTTGALRVIRHRLFESNIALTPPLSPSTPANPTGELPHKANYPKYADYNGHPLVYTTKKSYAHYGKLDPWRDFVLVYGGGNAPAEACRDAMGIDWMNRDELCEAIPPAYTDYVGRQLLLATSFAAPLPEAQLALF